MSACRISDAEREALRGLSHAAQLLYVLGLRPWMDYATGVAGAVRRITYQQLREVLTVEPVPGVPTPRAITDDQLKRRLAELERGGLIERCSVAQSHGAGSPRLHLQVRFLIAETDADDGAWPHSVQNQAATRPPLASATADAPVHVSEIKCLDDGEPVGPPEVCEVRPPRPPVSGFQTTTTAVVADRPQGCGGGEQKKAGAGGEAAQRELPLLGVISRGEPLPYELPGCLSAAQRLAAVRVLGEFDPVLAQQIADEWTAALNRDRVKDRMAYVHGLVRAARAGTFVPESGCEVAAARERRRRAVAAVAAAERMGMPTVAPARRTPAGDSAAGRAQLKAALRGGSKGQT